MEIQNLIEEISPGLSSEIYLKIIVECQLYLLWNSWYVIEKPLYFLLFSESDVNTSRTCLLLLVIVGVLSPQTVNSFLWYTESPEERGRDLSSTVAPVDRLSIKVILEMAKRKPFNRHGVNPHNCFLTIAFSPSDTLPYPNSCMQTHIHTYLNSAAFMPLTSNLTLSPLSLTLFCFVSFYFRVL